MDGRLRDRDIMQRAPASRRTLCASRLLEGRGRRTASGLAFAACLVLAPGAWAQPAGPRIGYVYPAGGRQGAACQIKVGGQFLDGVTSVYVSGAGVRARVIEHVKPITQQQFNMLREKLGELQAKRTAASNTKSAGGSAGTPASTNATWTAEDEKTVAEIRKKIATFVRRPQSPGIVETAVLEVTMAPDAELGERELRLGTPAGLSNPLVFCVGQLPECREPEPRSSDESRGGQPFRFAREAPTRADEAEVSVTLPAVLNGQIMPGDVDRYRFPARKGQQLVAAASARELIPYLADAVPGWFQAALTLYDAKGREVAFADDYRFHPDPVLHCEVPNDGEYVLEIRDAIYRGREDFVYRVAVGELPFVTSIFPLGGQAGAPCSVEVSGWNLPLAKLTEDAGGRGPGVYPVAVRSEKQVSNRLPFAVDELPDCLEKEPNNQPEHAQPLVPPVIVNGRLDRPGDCDVFYFKGRAGERFSAEVSARRLGSPLDSALRLTDASGRQLAFNDDHEDKGAGLQTHYADSWLGATLPTNGLYYLHLSEAQRKGGAEYAYRLRLSPPRPDFELRVVPSTINARAGATVPLTVYALRKDGFADEIALALRGAPRGFALSGGRVPAGQDQVRLTLTVPPAPLREPVSLRLEGRARIEGREVLRPGVPAEDMMQAFAYRHLVPVHDLMVAVTGRARFAPPLRVLGAQPVRIPSGGTARVRIGAPAGGAANRFHLELNEPPEGIAMESEGADIVLRSDAAKLKPGLQGNLIVTVFAERNLAAGARRPANNRRAAVGTLPAIPFEIVER